MATTTTPTLRLAERLLTSLSDATDTTKAADLASIVRADPSRVTLRTIEQVSGLSRVSPATFFQKETP